VNVGFVSTNVTLIFGSKRLSCRAQVAPAKPPPMMTTWAAPCAIAGAQTTAAEAAAATASIKSRRLNCLTRMAWMATSYRCAWYHSAMASISMSEKPLAIRSITVALRWPDRNARICATMSSALRPTSGGTLVSTTDLGGWQPEQAAAPAGGSEESAAAVVMDTMTNAAGTKARSKFMDHIYKGSGPPPRLRHSGFTRIVCYSS
jgi:hypothetical protein